MSPLHKFATACASLLESIHRIRSVNKSIFICCDFNMDLKNENAPLTQLLLSTLLPATWCFSATKIKAFFLCA